MTQEELSVALASCPLIVSTLGDTSFNEDCCVFKKEITDEGNVYFELLTVRRDDLDFLCKSLRSVFGSECLDPKIKWREFI